MILEEIRLTQEEAAWVIHFTQFCLYENITRGKEARERKAEDNIRDGLEPCGVIKHRIPSGPLVDQE